MVYSVGCPNNNCVNNYQTQSPINNKKPEETMCNARYCPTINLQPKVAPQRFYPVNYGKALTELSIQIDNLKPSLPILNNNENIDTIKGEKVYNSDGELKAIINNTNGYKTVYTIDDNNKLAKITTTDNKTGKIVKEQENLIENDKDMMFITDYDKTGKIQKNTVYADGKLETVGTLNKLTKNRSKMIVKDYTRDYNDYIERVELPNGENSQTITFSDDNKNIEIREEYEKNNHRKEHNITFYNGALVSIKNNNEITMPNIIGLEKLANKNLQPTNKLNKDLLTKQLEQVDGIKTNYSNGNIESLEGHINGEGIIAEFDIDGNLTKATFEKHTVEFSENGRQKITETLDNGDKKTTIFYDSGSTEVVYAKDDTEKSIYYDEKGNPTSYHERTLDDTTESMYFNEQGALTEKFKI